MISQGNKLIIFSGSNFDNNLKGLIDFYDT